jgi:hypothetical protein
MATQRIVKSDPSGISDRSLTAVILTSLILASVTLAVIVGIGALQAVMSAPTTTVAAASAEMDSLRDLRREEIGATIGLPSPIDSLREFRREEFGAPGGGSAIDALREHRRDEFGADTP